MLVCLCGADVVTFAQRSTVHQTEQNSTDVLFLPALVLTGHAPHAQERNSVEKDTEDDRYQD